MEFSGNSLLVKGEFVTKVLAKRKRHEKLALCLLLIQELMRLNSCVLLQAGAGVGSRMVQFYELRVRSNTCAAILLHLQDL
jgi:hypothetical protein